MSWGQYVLVGIILVGCVPMIVGSFRGRPSPRVMLFALACCYSGAIGLAILSATNGNMLALVPLIGLVPLGGLACAALWYSSRKQSLEGEALVEVSERQVAAVKWLVRFVLVTMVLVAVTMLGFVILQPFGE